MRAYLLFIGVLGLTGCAYQPGLQGDAKPLQSADLSAHHAYSMRTVKKNLASNDWWAQFNDPVLNELMRVALRDSPSTRAVESRLRKAQFLVSEYASTLWPYVDASGYVQRQRFSQSGLAPPPFNGRIFNIGELGLNFSYELDFWGKNRETLAAAISEACAASADLAQARLILSANVAQAYFWLQNAREQARLAQATYQTRRELLNIVKIRGRRGIDSDLPIKISESDVEAAKISVAQYQQTEKLARHQLSALLGKNAFETEIVAKTISYRRLRPLPNTLSANLLARRPDILASRLRTEAAAHQINVAKARFFPDINLIGLLSYQSVFLHRVFESGSRNNAIAGAFDLPLFDAGARRANLGVKYAEYEEAVNLYNQTILTALREVADQLTVLKTVDKQWRAQDIALSAIRRNFKLTQSRYRHGIVDYAEVLKTRETLLQQEAAQVDWQVQHQQALAALIVALGGNGVAA